MNEQLKEFIEQNIDLIESKDYTSVYKKLYEFNAKNQVNLCGEFIELLLSADINPLFDITVIPERFACESKLENIFIPSNVREISSMAFAFSKKLKHVVIEEGVQKIGGSAFEHCCKDCHVVLPSSITYIGNYAFASIGDMTLTYNGTKKQFKSLTCSNNVFDYTFYTCKCLDGVVEKKRRNK